MLPDFISKIIDIYISIYSLELLFYEKIKLERIDVALEYFTKLIENDLIENLFILNTKFTKIFIS